MLSSQFGGWKKSSYEDFSASVVVLRFLRGAEEKSSNEDFLA